MGKRKAPRVAQTLTARIFGLDSKGKAFSFPVETIDVSYSGARLAGVTNFEGPGEIIGLEANGNKGRFQVVWVGRRGTKAEGQIGVRNVESHKSLWSAMPREARDEYRAPHIHSSFRNSEVLTYLEWRDDRRTQKRHPLRAGVKFSSNLRKGSGWGTCTDITRAGCHIETATPLPLEARVDLLMRINGRDMTARGVVRNARPNWGMGIEFLEVSEEDRQFIIELSQPKGRLGAARRSE